VEIGSACRWTIFHAPFSRRNVVVTRRSNGSTDSRLPILARERVRERHVVRFRVELLHRLWITAREGIGSTVVAIEEVVQAH
jgi:hypothetical protein